MSFLNSSPKYTEQQFRALASQLGFQVSPYNMRGAVDVYDLTDNRVASGAGNIQGHQYIHCEVQEIKAAYLPQFLQTLRTQQPNNNRLAFYEVSTNFGKDIVKFAIIGSDTMANSKVAEDSTFLKK